MISVAEQLLGITLGTSAYDDLIYLTALVLGVVAITLIVNLIQYIILGRRH